ncbi:hypothetical protein H1P_1590013 [Hyella patelloides LEGE 07179]|uniref:Uncharacterized protein n=1 Tax=Hyella patelloides LEGE 07179 TaxID=945734 RepID=A0A563VMK3_9CYAN|nr:hypothetical protein H1P_1590013 [Hyella patelloides LEGE 07179]
MIFLDFFLIFLTCNTISHELTVEMEEYIYIDKKLRDFIIPTTCTLSATS